MKFDGKKLAQEKYNELQKVISRIDHTPKLVSFVIGMNESAMKYQQMKQTKAREIGCELWIETVSAKAKIDEITTKITNLNKDTSVHGIMIQLPVPARFTEKDRQTMINTIDPFKDVDGMREESVYVAPVVMAVEEALREAQSSTSKASPSTLETLIVGSRGFVGSKIFTRLKQVGFKNIKGVDVDTPNWTKRSVHADVVVSAVGKTDLIKPSMIKKGSILIDVGAPKGDISPECFDKSAFYTPVPGGIGPVTIYYLMENLVKAADQ